MTANNSDQYNKNLIIPAWVRVLIIVPFLVLFVFIAIYLGNVYEMIADVQISWFDGYYVILTFLLMMLVYLLVLVICLLPGIFLLSIVRKFYENKSIKNSKEPN
ncbi:MAG: hypothetical protein IT222_06940 [Crocinitomix sp.]|nr:hypothetical protein [Crocinitomix sp.]